jgi:hypothetical protein
LSPPPQAVSPAVSAAAPARATTDRIVLEPISFSLGLAAGVPV